MCFVGCSNPEPTLEAPHNIVASNRTYNDKVVVGWDAVTGASRYRLFRSPAPEGPYASPSKVAEFQLGPSRLQPAS